VGHMRVIWSFLLLSTLLFGVELEVGKRYQGPIKLTANSLGVSMGLPKSWEAEVHKKGLTLSQDDSHNTIRLYSKQMSLAEATEYLNRTHYIKGGIKIFPQQSVFKVNPHILRRSYAMSGAFGSDEVLLYVVLGSQNRAVVLLAQYEPKDDASIRATTMHIVQALSFTPTLQLKNMIQDLTKRLKGVHIVYMRRDGAYDNKRELWFCSNMRYLLLDNRTVAGGQSRVLHQHFGQWSVDDTQLVLQGDDGLDTLINVAIKDKSLLMDGVRSYELANHKCR